MTDAGRGTAEYLVAWAEYVHGSPLYKHLTAVIAEDPDLLRILGGIEHLPQPNVFLGAVHLLLLQGLEVELGSFYRSLTPMPRPAADVGPFFRQFVLEHEDEILVIGRTRYTQTNEVRRCAALLPLVTLAPFDRFHLIDVGCSAGLNLGLDLYGYRWGEVTWGSSSDLVIDSDSRGMEPAIPSFEILRRVGLDLMPVDSKDEAAVAWLDALIWPEHVERRARLRSALSVISALPLELVAGDALEMLPRVLDALPRGEPVVIMGSFVLLQFTSEEISLLTDTIDQARAARAIHRVSMEVELGEGDWANLVIDDGSGEVLVGKGHPHGDWIELYDSYARP